MALVGRHCPDIRHIMFMYQSEVCQLSYLAAFERLTTLDVWGGSFYVDGFIELLEVRRIRKQSYRIQIKKSWLESCKGIVVVC